MVRTAITHGSQVHPVAFLLSQTLRLQMLPPWYARNHHNTAAIIGKTAPYGRHIYLIYPIMPKAVGRRHGRSNDTKRADPEL